ENHLKIGVSGDELVFVNGQPATGMLASVLPQPRALTVEGPRSRIRSGQRAGGRRRQHSGPVLNALRVRPVRLQIIDVSARLLNSAAGDVIPYLGQLLQEFVSIAVRKGLLIFRLAADLDLADDVHSLPLATRSSRV